MTVPSPASAFARSDPLAEYVRRVRLGCGYRSANCKWSMGEKILVTEQRLNRFNFEIIFNVDVTTFGLILK